ncbi:hypothetical protein RF11_10133 [Thelohanellus kitauei]|uniref:Uncharacterized protein n=1 Tax=Thelohanellus kitauei TaxID=669202 RepID=A0A0C2JA58_THEKT|nr:hypothetical protein RF11_10133 [Thelohanellus kitauei]
MKNYARIIASLDMPASLTAVDYFVAFCQARRLYILADGLINRSTCEIYYNIAVREKMVALQTLRATCSSADANANKCAFETQINDLLSTLQFLTQNAFVYQEEKRVFLVMPYPFSSKCLS